MASAKKAPEKYLPGFASFLLTEHLEAVAKDSLKISRELDIPLLKLIQIPEEQLVELSKAGIKELLTAFAEDKIDELITASVVQWRTNQLNVVDRSEVVADDITLVALVRKRMFLNFLPAYTTDPQRIIAIVHEIDEYIEKFTSESFKTYTNILNARIEQHLDELRRSDTLFRQAQAVTHIGSYVWDLQLRTLKWSDELYRIYELEPGKDTITNEIVGVYNHPDDTPIVNECIRKSIESHEPFNFYYRIILKGGRERILHARGEIECDTTGTPVKIIGTAQDVTERQELFEELQESDQRYKQAQALTHMGNWSWDIANNYVEWTDELYRIYGLEPDPSKPIDYATWMSRVHPDDREKSAQETARSLETKLPNEFYHRIIHPDGTIKTIHAKSEVVLNKDGSPKTLIGTTQDVTEQKRIEHVLLMKTMELQQSNQSLEEFAFIASHDLKEPLRKISTLSDRLLTMEKQNLTSDGKVYLQKVINSSIRMQQMIEDLLALAQVASDRSYQRVNLQSLLADVLQMVDQKIEESGAKVTGNQLPFAKVVPSQFRQLFQNLISNSLKFARPNVAVNVTITHEYLSTHAGPEFNLPPAERYLKLVFSDNGIGFDNRFLPKIFSIFQRLHPPSKYEGTGIGLSICKKIVENHGGVITADGVLDKGATFTVIIPENM